MKVLLVLSCAIALVWSLPIDDADPNDQVELVPATRNNEGIPDAAVRGSDAGLPVLIFTSGNRNRGAPLPALGTSGFLPFLEAILGGGHSEDDSGEDRLPSFPQIGEIDLNIGEEDALFPPIGGIFGGGGSERDGECGPFCMIFRSLDKQLKNIEDQLKEVKANRENELQPTSSEQGDDAQPETTYEEKVLADGTVVKIRKTSFSDTSDDGTSYFGYHSTRVVSASDDDSDDEAVEEEVPRVDEFEVTEENKDTKPIKLIQQENGSVLKRRKRQWNPFNQQVEDVSYLNNQVSQKPFSQVQVSQDPFNQVQVSQNPFNQVVQARTPLVSPTLVRNLGAAPKPISLEGDTRVNDLLLENARRGGLVRIEPDSEFIDGDGTLALAHRS